MLAPVQPQEIRCWFEKNNRWIPFFPNLSPSKVTRSYVMFYFMISGCLVANNWEFTWQNKFHRCSISLYLLVIVSSVRSTNLIWINFGFSLYSNYFGRVFLLNGTVVESKHENIWLIGLTVISVGELCLTSVRRLSDQNTMILFPGTYQMVEDWHPSR